MPYKHSGEIGDVWKHLPLCDILEIEVPKRYYETNAAYAEYTLQITNQNMYGVFHLFEKGKQDFLKNSVYFKILSRINLLGKHKYYGSPALAMVILCKSNTSFYFHDVEQQPLDDIVKFSEKLKIQDKITISCGDSISAFLQDGYCFNEDDFVFIDPYTPFDCNESGNDFFDVFIKAYKSHAKTMLWYGYDNLKDKNRIIEKLQTIPEEFTGGSIYTFDVWQKCMRQDACKLNPGVPGCGIAMSNLSNPSILRIRDYLYLIGDLYENVIYDGGTSSLCLGCLTL